MIVSYSTPYIDSSSVKVSNVKVYQAVPGPWGIVMVTVSVMAVDGVSEAIFNAGYRRI